MTQQIKEILGNLLFKYEDAEDDIVIIQTKFEQMEAQLKKRDEEIERLKAELEEANEIIGDYAEVQAQMTP